MAKEYRVPWRIRLQRMMLRPFFRGVFHALYRVRITGRDNVPKSGAYLVAHNHVSIVEPPFVLSFWPVAAEAIGTEELWQRPGQSTIVRLYGTIPVERNRAMDRQFLQKLVTLLKEGHPLVIAPEGGRSHVPAMRRAEPGIAYLADQAQVRVVPVGIVGSMAENLQAALKRKRPLIEMRIGQPFHLPPLDSHAVSRREARQLNADLVMRRIAALLPKEYQGVYAEPFLSPQAAQ